MLGRRTLWSFVCFGAGIGLIVLLLLAMRQGMAFYALIVQGLVVLLAVFIVGIALGWRAERNGEGPAAVVAIVLNALGLVGFSQVMVLMPG